MPESIDPNLTPAQEKVLALLSAGSTFAAAAAAAEVHRNTIAYWRASSPIFRQALYDAFYEKSLYWREHTEQLVAAAADSLRAVLADPNAPAAVRVKAALAILDKASAPPPPFPDDFAGPQVATQADVAAAIDAYVNAPIPGHTPGMILEMMHKNAQSPTRKVGRNEPCHCGSGMKFKRCCANKPPAAPQQPVPDSAPQAVPNP